MCTLDLLCLHKKSSCDLFLIKKVLNRMFLLLRPLFSLKLIYFNFKFFWDELCFESEVYIFLREIEAWDDLILEREDMRLEILIWDLLPYVPGRDLLSAVDDLRRLANFFIILRMMNDLSSRIRISITRCYSCVEFWRFSIFSIWWWFLLRCIK